MLDILSIGDAKIDIYLQIPDNNPHLGLNENKDKLLVSYGEKIVVDKYILDVGGNATNAAVGFSRLGLKAGLCAEIGKDELSGKILKKLNTEKVSTEFLIQNENEQTSISIALNYKNDRTLFSEHVTRDHQFNFSNLKTKAIYLTSLGKYWEKAYETVLAYAKNNKCILGFNPGSVQLESRNKFVLNILENCSYLFVNKEEAEEIIYGKEFDIKFSENNIKKLLYGLKDLGTKNAIITDGENGSFSYTEKGEFLHAEIAKAKVVEKTGAGDAFATAFMAAIIHQQEISEAMIWGAINSASVIENIGAQQGLLNINELETRTKNSNLVSRKF